MKQTKERGQGVRCDKQIASKQEDREKAWIERNSPMDLTTCQRAEENQKGLRQNQMKRLVTSEFGKIVRLRHPHTHRLYNAKQAFQRKRIPGNPIPEFSPTGSVR